jgi:hypothetical protein
MAKAVLIQSRHAAYADVPGERDRFPTQAYLSVAAQTLGGWVIFYEGRRGGASTARPSACCRMPTAPASSPRG